MKFTDIEPYLTGFYNLYDLDSRSLDFDYDAPLIETSDIDSIGASILFSVNSQTTKPVLSIKLNCHKTVI